MDENKYFNSELGVQIWNKKYRTDNESFDSWLTRVSGGDPEVHQLIKDKKFMFGGRILANRGIEGKNVSMSNCYTVGLKEDSLDSIFETAGKLAKIFSWGGGIGTDISNLSPRGASINNAAKTTSGAVSFMELFNTTSALIGSDGRRSALLLSIKSEHPDLLEFIDVKTNDTSILKANISVQVSDIFMDNVMNKRNHTMSFIRHTGEQISKSEDANYILDRLVYNNYNYAEPGIQYVNRLKEYNLMQFVDDFELISTNACSEKMLPDNGACLLGSLNLSEFVSNGEFDYGSFCVATRIAIGALNDVLDEGVDKHPLQEQIDVAKKWRDIGLGVMGYADALIKLGITYGSEECITFTKDLSRTMFNEALKASSTIRPDESIFNRTQLQNIIDSEIVQMNCDTCLKSWILEHGLRNCALLSIAPTGSISTMLGISGGIEPHYALSYTRRTESLHGEEKSYNVSIPIVDEFMSNVVDWRCETKLPDYFVTAKDIHWKERLRVQEAWQNSVDASISSTINLPEDTSEATIKRIYIEAWKLGLKGITIYRDNCSRQGVLSETKEPVDDYIDSVEYVSGSIDADTLSEFGFSGMSDVRCDLNELEEEQVVYIDDLKDSTQDSIDAAYELFKDTKQSSDIEELRKSNLEFLDSIKEPTEFKRGEWNKLSDDLTYIKRKIYTGCGKLTLFIGYSIENSKIEEIYIKRSGKGGCARSLDALAITMSSMLRLGGNIENIEQAFEGLEPCSSFIRERAKGKSLSLGSNCAMAMLKELQQFMWECGEDTVLDLCNIDSVNDAHPIPKEEFMCDYTPVEFVEDPDAIATWNPCVDSTNQCLECKSELQHTGGCVSCMNCGYTRCD